MNTTEACSSVSNLLKAEMEKGTFPGAVIGIVNNKQIIYKKAFGYSQLKPVKRAISLDTIFDLASLTKVITTTTAVMQLIEKGQINLWDYIKEYFPEVPADKGEITIFHLMTHTSGFQAIVRLWDKGLNSSEEKIEYIFNLPLEYKTGTRVVYSDPNFILLGELVQRVSGNRLDSYTRKNIFQPLGMEKTCFKPLENDRISIDNIAATEWCDWRGKMVVGEVHDENCASFDGITGHAGLFSNIDDLTVFVRMLLNKGNYNGIDILHPRSVELMTRNWTTGLDSKRGLGWDLSGNFRSSGGVLMSPAAYGHTGFTGTSIWIDPTANLGVILLTNRVHPTRDNVKIISLRPRLHNLVVTSFLKERDNSL